MMFQTYIKSLAIANTKSIVSVSIFLSDFGTSELEYERTHGPRLDLGTAPVSEEELGLMTPEQQEAHRGRLNEAVRKYQKNKLRYYYAIAEFDNPQTAEIIYNELDGLTASFCAASLDLRFVPDNTEIPRSAISVCDKVSDNFRPAAFDDGGAAVGLDNANVKLTWDEDPPERKILRRKFNAQEIMDLELQQYLASSSDDEDAVPVDRDAYRRALLGEEEKEDSRGAKCVCGRGCPVEENFRKSRLCYRHYCSAL
ncbi:hypothetical protein C9890_0286 [Perkinsus sp. BL_2016]|nr:hypothetical protein C9890_0286 [Perkinsus sp. BL_2016]